MENRGELPELPIEIWELIVQAIPDDYVEFALAVCKSWREFRPTPKFIYGTRIPRLTRLTNNRHLSCVRMISRTNERFAINAAILKINCSEISIEILDDLFGKGYRLNKSNMFTAIRTEDLMVLDWLKNKNCPYSLKMLSIAFLHKCAKVVDWLMTNNYQFSTRSLRGAIHDDVEYLDSVVEIMNRYRYLCIDLNKKHGFFRHGIIIDYSVGYCSEEVLRRLMSYESLTSLSGYSPIHVAIRKGRDVEFLEVLYNLGAQLEHACLATATDYSNIAVMSWLFKKEITIDNEYTYDIHDIETLFLLRDNGYDLTIKYVIPNMIHSMLRSKKSNEFIMEQIRMCMPITNQIREKLIILLRQFNYTAAYEWLEKNHP